MSNSIVLAADPSRLASLRLCSGTHLRRANSAPVLPHRGLPPLRGLPRVARVVAAPRDPGGSTAIIDRLTHSRALTSTSDEAVVGKADRKPFPDGSSAGGGDP